MSDEMERCVWPLGECTKQAHIKELEAELAKAQGLIRKIVDPKGYADDPWSMAFDYVAELTGGKDE